ncbi:hypothetical protein LXL04_028374 [Taraxacum kok-saghyz]
MRWRWSREGSPQAETWKLEGLPKVSSRRPRASKPWRPEETRAYHWLEDGENEGRRDSSATKGFCANLQTSQNTETQSRDNKWDVAEDIALMSAWSIVSQNRKHGKNQRKESLWAQVKVLYVQAQQENPKNIGNMNKDQMKGHYNRHSDNASKWVGAYQEAYRRKTSGMSQKDIEDEAQKIYEANGNKSLSTLLFSTKLCVECRSDH